MTAEPDRVGLDPRLLLGSTDDEVLRCYLDLVRSWRGTKPGGRPRLRQADVAVLVSILGTNSAEIERRLVAATSCTTAAARRGRRVLLASLGGALTIGLTATTVGGGATATRLAPSSASRQNPIPILVDAPSTTTALGEPASSTTTDAAPVPEAVSPRDTEATVSIPSLGIDLPVVEGGQAVIDDGVVAHYEAAGWKDPVAAGAAGTYWLAAHHATHGAPFAALPSISVGAEIRIATDTKTFVYTVTSTAVVGLLPGDVAIYGVDESSPVILLQTCIDSTRRLLVHGTLTETLEELK